MNKHLLIILYFLWPMVIGMTTVEYGSKPVQDGECQRHEVSEFKGHRFCGDDVKDTVLCRPNGGFITHFQDGLAFKSCSYQLECPAGSFIGKDCDCSVTAADCFHQIKDCHVPKNITLPRGNCAEKDWDLLKPKFCSIGTKKDGCSELAKVMTLAYVVDRDGKTHWLSDLTIEHANPINTIDSYFFDTHLASKGNPTGEQEYCNYFPSELDCLKASSRKGRPYRILKQNSLYPYFHGNGCQSPVYCYGYKTVEVFGYEEGSTSGICEDCSFVCKKDEYHAVLNMVGLKHVEVCGRSECWIDEIHSTVLERSRTFHSKIDDDRLKITAYNEDRTVRFVKFSKCEKTPICDAIDCYFCKVHWFNVSCYQWYDWIICLLGLYASMLLVAITISIVRPLAQLMYHLICYVFKFIGRLCSIMTGAAKRRAKNLDRAVMREAEEAVPMIRRGNGSIVKTPIGIRTMVLLTILGTAFAKAPCAYVVVDEFNSESCNLIGNSYHCKPSKIIDIPIIAYDQTTCLHYISPNGKIMAELQITPYSVSFQCQKQYLYSTRDFELTSDHIIRCPHSGYCTEEWCSSVNKGTKVADLPEVDFPYDQFCKLGSACWGNGCFYCTSSCHTIRYLAKPRSSTVFDVFTCPRWDPSGVFHLAWFSHNKQEETTISLIHGQTKTGLKGLQATLFVDIQTKLPSLGKSFLQKGDSIAIVDSSYAGQPIAGQIGQIQCENQKVAVDMKNCKMAPNICVCRPEASDDGCDCSQIDIEGSMNSRTILPQSIGDYHIDEVRGVPLLKTAAYGSGKIRIRGDMTLVGDSSPAPKCEIDIKDLDGCHSCITGAQLRYRCKSDEPQAIILDCDGRAYITMHCDNSMVIRNTTLSISSPLVSMLCKASCSSDAVSVRGLLKSVGTPVISGASHIALVPGAAKEGFFEWLKNLWNFLGWFNMLWIILGVLALILILIIIYRIMPKPTNYKYKGQ